MNSCEKWATPTHTWEVPSLLAPGAVQFTHCDGTTTVAVRLQPAVQRIVNLARDVTGRRALFPALGRPTRCGQHVITVRRVMEDVDPTESLGIAVEIKEAL